MTAGDAPTPRLTPPDARGAAFGFELVGQQAPPPGGYSVELFAQQISTMRARFERLRRARDWQAPFQLTYLTFSERIFQALTARRFRDHAWATDMCCRFIEVYEHQLGRWQSRDPGLCRPWRIAFESMEDGKVNALQAMLLGMNAHIHYDLAFTTLGACRWAGDLPDSAARRSLAASRSGVPAGRYHDFLLVNQVGWESLSHIQDEVLSTFSRLFYWGNRLVRDVSKRVGQRVFLHARDTSWTQTTLLIHARDGVERSRVARVIDAYAASIADLLGGLTWRPDLLLESAGSWLRRWERLDPDVQSGLVELALDNPVVAELALRELAFVGADPVSVIETLLHRGAPRLAGTFGQLALSHAPLRRRQRLMRHLASAEGTVALEMVEQASALPVRLAGGAALERVHARHRQRLAQTRAALRDGRVARLPELSRALDAQAIELERKVGPAGAAAAPVELEAFLDQNPDRWIRVCATQVFPKDGTKTMSTTIERVMFLKETTVFVEADPGVLVHLAEKLVSRRFAAGERVVRAGEQHGGLHLIRSGSVRVSQERGGQRVSIATLGPRDSVGELSALNDTPPTADCDAVTDVETLFVPTEVLSHLLHQHPRLSIGLIRMLSQRLMETTLRVPAASAT